MDALILLRVPLDAVGPHGPLDPEREASKVASGIADAAEAHIEGVVVDTRNHPFTIRASDAGNLADKVVSGFTLYMAALRDPQDIARNRDRDEAVRFILRDRILTPEQVDPHISTHNRIELQREGLI